MFPTTITRSLLTCVSIFLHSAVAGGGGIVVCRAIDRLDRGPVHVAAGLRIVEISSRGRVLSENGVVCHVASGVPGGVGVVLVQLCEMPKP